MICYRAESSMANLLTPHYKRSKDENRTLVKALIQTPIDLICDHKSKKLTISLYSQSNKRMNYAAEKLCAHLNETETKYPGTNLTLHYKIATSTLTAGQEVWNYSDVHRILLKMRLKSILPMRTQLYTISQIWSGRFVLTTLFPDEVCIVLYMKQ